MARLFLLLILCLVVGTIGGLASFYIKVLVKKNWKDAYALAMWQPRPYITYDEDGPVSWWFYRKMGKQYAVLFERNKLGAAWNKFWWKKCKEWMPVRLVKE